MWKRETRECFTNVCGLASARANVIFPFLGSLFLGPHVCDQAEYVKCCFKLDQALGACVGRPCCEFYKLTAYLCYYTLANAWSFLGIILIHFYWISGLHKLLAATFSFAAGWYIFCLRNSFKTTAAFFSLDTGTRRPICNSFLL